MNAVEVTERVRELVPQLLEEYGEEFKKAQQLRAHFTRDFPVERILGLKRDEYVVGKGASNRSFCYRLEQEMWMLGNILGSPSPKFGVYYGRTNSDPSVMYRGSARWGATVDGAFSQVKQAIVELLRAAEDGNASSIAENPLPQTIKGKLLHVYFPEQYAPIYSARHLTHFVTNLDLPGDFKVGTNMQKALMDYRARWPELQGHTPLLFMRFLYRVFGAPPEKGVVSSGAGLVPPMFPFLNQAVAGAQFLDTLPNPSPAEKSSGRRTKKPDYEAHAKHCKRVGERGEAIVYELEKRRLIAAGRPDLAKDVVRVSETDDRLGYDILSFETDEAERLIEVKATTSATLDAGFFISDTELQQSKSLPNHFLYVVLAAMSKQPRIWIGKQPFLDGNSFTLRPIVYHVSLTNQP